MYSNYTTEEVYITPEVLFDDTIEELLGLLKELEALNQSLKTASHKAS